jgi:hypothetical protein
MSAPDSRLAEPNVVPPEAAARTRSLVFDYHDRPVIVPLDVVQKLIEEGHGAQFESGVRAARVLTWVKQVFRRLNKHGWLARRTDTEWLPTAALVGCHGAEELAGRPRRRIRGAPERRAVAPGPARAYVATGLRPTPVRVDPWPGFVESWVREHRDEPFGIGDIVADMIRRGFGSGTIRERLDEARMVAEKRLRELGVEPPLRDDVAGDHRHPPEATEPGTARPARSSAQRSPSPDASERSSGQRAAGADPRPRSPVHVPAPPALAIGVVDGGVLAVECPPDPGTSDQRRTPAMDADLDTALAIFRKKLAAASREAEFYARMIGELEGMIGSAPVADEPAVEEPETPAPEPMVRKARQREAKGGMTIVDAVRKVIADAGRPLTPAEIVPEAARLAGSAEISVRTSITPLAQKGVLTKVEHEGRGYKYGIPVVV